MKTIKLLLVACLLVTLTGCDSKNSYPPGGVNATIYLQFQDAKGNDLVKGIRYDATSKEGTTYDISQGECRVFMATEEHSTQYTPFNRIKLNLTEQDQSILCTGVGDLNFTPVTKLKIECPHIFGDEKEHTIITYWREYNHLKEQPYCIKITIDGKEASVARDPQGLFHTATFVVERPH